MTPLDEALVNELIGHESKNSAAAWDNGWRPSLTPTQRKVFDDDSSLYILCHGPRGTGKTVAALHKLAKHAFLNHDACGFIIVREVGQAKEGGAWDKLIYDVLPEWREGIGVQWTEARLDPETKKPYIWIRNRHGTASKIVCFSLPVAEHVSDKMKGREPTMVVVDEAQTMVSDTYFTAVIQQLQRRHGIVGEQQLVLCANPAGPSHWLYKRFWEMPLEEDGQWNTAYARYFFPIEENIKNLPKGYYDRVIEATRGDPIERARMLQGEWLDRPTGRALFSAFYNEKVHVRGNAAKGIGIYPVPGHVVMVGYDLGPAHSSVHFMQLLPLKDKMVWVVFDTLDYVSQYVPYRDVAAQIVRRMDYWNELCGCQFTYDHVSDDSAFNQLRGDGDYDALQIERHSNGRIRLRPAPKGKGSVVERVRLLMELLQKEEIVISATCLHTRTMLMYLECENVNSREYVEDAGLRPRKGPQMHRFDSLTYPILAVAAGHRRGWTTGDTHCAIFQMGTR